MGQLQEETLRLKRLMADLTLDKTMLQDVLSKNVAIAHETRIRWWATFIPPQSTAYAAPLLSISAPALIERRGATRPTYTPTP